MLGSGNGSGSIGSARGDYERAVSRCLKIAGIKQRGGEHVRVARRKEAARRKVAQGACIFESTKLFLRCREERNRHAETATGMTRAR